MELSHESHEHSLFFVDGESDTDILVRCWACAGDICGARYTCFACDFHLHKSCTELPPRLEDHPFHPQHPLSLLPRSPDGGGYECKACGQDCDEKNFVYQCSLCKIDLHIMCALSVDLRVSIIAGRNGEKEMIRYGAGQHLLMLVEEQSTSLDMDGDDCFVCRESVSAPFYFCSRSLCDFRLHKSCADLHQQIQINFFHPQHPLFLFPNALKSCQICDRSLNVEHAYVCILCDFCIHPRCAFSNSTDVINRRRRKGLDRVKRKVERKYRADELPQKIKNNYFHPQHPLFLDSECSGECKICGQETDQSTYACKPCDFFCHLRCALLNPSHITKRVGEKQFQHSSHRHSLTLLQDMREWGWNAERSPPHCDFCRKKVDSIPSYGCKLCSFILHKSCAELPPQIKSHLHPDHFLFSFPKPPPGKSYCACCAEKISGLNYQCIRCGFILHVDCFLSLQGFEQLYDHKHCFIELKTFHKLSCQTCGEEGYFSPWLCRSCHILVHKKMCFFAKHSQTSISSSLP